MKLEIIKNTTIYGTVDYEILANGIYVANSFTSGDNAEEVIMQKFEEVKKVLTNPKKEVFYSEEITP
jgi:hypothetical protein